VAGEIGSAAGTLYLVATPIGNVGDISARAIETLRTVERVLCEDTRRTRRLLNRLGIAAELESHHEHNERERIPGVVRALRGGSRFALVSDAGTPGISDPGFRLVRACAEAGVRVVPVPGPSAVIAALTASGLPTDRFCFVGYLPQRPGRRRASLEELSRSRGTIVLFEAPHRVARTVELIIDVLGDREAALCRELTKLHEEIVRGRLSSILSGLQSRRPLGEITLVIAGALEHDAA
jgi:16S rRNA (cytidine1402-2'-O)-methyltransferase